MKRTLCLILSLLLILSCAGAEIEPDDDTVDAESLLELITGTQTAEDSNPNPEETNKLIFSDLVASGNKVWRIAKAEIICADAATEQELARFPLKNLYEGEQAAALEAAGLPSAANYDIEWLSLLSRNETGIRLCATLKDENDAYHVLLYDLNLSDTQITINNITDTTTLLGSFFDKKNKWLEIDMTSLGQDAFLIAALDQNHMFNLFNCHPDNDNLTELGTQPLLLYNSSVPYGSDLLLVGFSAESINSLALTPVDSNTGDRGEPINIEMEADPSSAGNFAWCPDDHMLYFTVDNTAFRVSPESGNKPEPFYIMDKEPLWNRLGLIIDGKYILYKENGDLYYIDTDTKLTSTRIRVADTSGNADLPAIASMYNGIQFTDYVTVPVIEDENLILEYLLNQSADNDIYVLSMNSNVFHAMKNRKYCPDLGGSETIRNALANMPEYLRSFVSPGDTPVALPVCVYNECITLNVKAMQELTGLPREELPTDWSGFLRLLNQIAKDGILKENTQYTVSDAGSTINELKQELFGRIMSDCLLWMNRTHAEPDAIPSTLLPVLHAFSEIEWDGFGLPEDEPEDITWLLANEQVPLLSMIQPEIAVMAMENGVEYWPLSMNEETERLIPQTVSVMVINPWSAHPQEALSFMEYVWEHLDILQKMMLCPELNEPVPNTAYEEDIAYLEQMISSYDTAIESADSGTDVETLRGERNSAMTFLEDYRKNASWLASAESIAEYRTLSEQMEPAVPEFWSADNEDVAILQFLDGMIPAEQFVTQYVEAMKTARMEGY